MKATPPKFHVEWFNQHNDRHDLPPCYGAKELSQLMEALTQWDEAQVIKVYDDTNNTLLWWVDAAGTAWSATPHRIAHLSDHLSLEMA